MQLTKPSTRCLKRPRSLSRPLLLILLLASLSLAAGCSPKLVAVKSDPCAGWLPIYASKTDVLSDSTAKQILGHDCHGVQQKCWKDPTPPGHVSACPAPIAEKPKLAS